MTLKLPPTLALTTSANNYTHVVLPLHTALVTDCHSTPLQELSGYQWVLFAFVYMMAYVYSVNVVLVYLQLYIRNNPILIQYVQ